MNWPKYESILSGSERGLSAQCVRCGLHFLSLLHALGSRLFHWGFDLGIRRVHRAPVPVISIGNLTAGGTGKTPLVACVARRLGQHGCAPCLVSRGYKATSDGENDEKRVLAIQCPQVPHVQQADRVAAAAAAVDRFEARSIVLDDGFQHRRLGRDLDVVLIDCTRPWGFGYQLPRGLLREAVGGLKRADVVVLTRVDQVDASELAEIEERIKRIHPEAARVQIRFQPTRWRNVAGETRELGALTSQSAIAFSGLGHPENFWLTLRQLGISTAAQIAFPDHHHYSAADLNDLAVQAQNSGASVLLTTLKDLVKLDTTELAGIPVWALEIEVAFEQGEDRFNAALDQVIEQVRASQAPDLSRDPN